MARNGQPIQLIIAKGLRPSAVPQTRPIAHRVVDVIGFVDLAAGGRELMQDAGHLTRRVISVGGLNPLGMDYGHSDRTSQPAINFLSWGKIII